MPDISMCQNRDCQLRSNCYRYRAIPSPYMQSYGKFTPRGGKCEHFANAKDSGYRIRKMIEIEPDAKDS